MTTHPSHSAPPVIRVFLSSTFADMERERSYFNEVLTPKISRICNQRGVSFFSVDLRWGITHEDQVNGQVLPICLGEIDKCRPYFIGIVGNRYGSVLETVPEHIARSIPWLTGKEGHSITELEMLYAVLDKEKSDGCVDCAFYMRSDRLSREMYGTAPNESDGARRRLDDLKRRITEDEAIPSAAYDSMEEFGEMVMRDLMRWLDEHFPASADVNLIRRQWYDGELLRDYLPSASLEHFLDTYAAESKKPLLFYGDGARGKTAFLTAWQPNEGHKIVVNIAADDRFAYWPTLARHLALSIRELQSDCGLPEGVSAEDGDVFYTADEDKERFAQAFVQWFGGLKVSQPIAIVINDLNLLEDEQGRLLSWLPAVPPAGIRLFGSTNDDEMVQNASMLGWNIKEMPLFDQKDAAALVTDYLHACGKKLTQEQTGRLLKSVCARYPGQLRFVAAFLVNFGRFNSLDTLIDRIGEMRRIDQMYRYAYDYLMTEYEQRERGAVRLVLGLVRAATFSLNERLCYELCRRTYDVTAIEWARCCRIFEQFGIVQGDYWNLRNEEMQKFVDQLLDTDELKQAHTVLGDHYLQLMRDDADAEDVRTATAYAKAVLLHYRSAEAWDKLTDALSEHRVLCRLYKLDWRYVRSAWMALFLNTPHDLSDRLMALIERYAAAEGEENRAIALRVGGLFVDLDLQARYDEACRALGVKNLPSGIHSASEWMMTKAFASLYHQMMQMKTQGWHRELLNYADKLMAQSLPLNAMETCRLWYLKADCEARLRLYDAATKTVNGYYEMAIKAGLSYEMVRALTLRGEIVYHMERIQDAMEIQERLVQMALQNGDLDGYLAARNMLGMCMSRSRRYLEANIIFDILLEQWQRLGSDSGYAGVFLNKCNALHFGGKTREALDAAKEYYDRSRSVEALKGVCVQLLGNMGGYATALKEYDTAETYLQDAVAQAKAMGHESALSSAYENLAKMYRASDRWMKAVEVWEEQMEFLWGRGEYDTLLSVLNDAIVALHHYSYAKRAKLMEAQWRERFATIEGGSEIFEKSRRADETVDTVQVDHFREQMIMAKGEGNVQKQAELLCRWADAIKDSAPDEAVSHLLEAVALYRSLGLAARVFSSVHASLGILIRKGKVRNEALCQQVLDSIGDGVIPEIVRLWTELADHKLEEDAAVYPKLAALMAKGAIYEPLMALFVTDMNGILMYLCAADELIALVESFSPRLRDDVCDGFDHAMFDDEGRGTSDLKVDFLSPAATEKLRFYEKCVAFLQHFGHLNAAAMAGNIALIFRRRKDKEKTLYYHSLSAKAFEQAKKPEDALIEMMNLATAYREFDDFDGSIDLLKEALKLAGEWGEKKMEALIAGNLASCLVQLKRVEDKEDILRYFALEEAYFRATANDRDLVISLVNQMIFLIDKAEVSQWQGKLQEAKALVDKHHFDDFRTALTRLEWMAGQKTAQPVAAENQSEDDFRQKVEGLLAAVGNYQITNVECANGTYRAVCAPVKADLPGTTLLYFFYRYESGCAIGTVGVYQPPMHLKDLEKVTAYMNWWNTLNEYEINYDAEQRLFRADARLMAPDWGKLALRLRRFHTLWETDKVNLMSMILDIVDVDLAQGAKLRAMDETTDTE